ncbi:MAG TPA: VanZ family protein [Gemmatimonadales bacterium]|nr:VanZ family protein [Gemmatimonadales bacterium]
MTGLRTPAAKRLLGMALAGSGLLAILGLTLYPSPKQAKSAALTPLYCLVCGESGGADVFLNLLLFVPMAAGLRLLDWPSLRVVAVSAALSLGVESLQYFVVEGRDASLSDLLTNTTGGAVGAALASRARRLLAPGLHLARKLSAGAAAAWLGVLLFSAFALRPWAPREPLRNYCTAAYPTSEVFAGTARSVTLNGVPLPCDGVIALSRPIAERLRKGELALDVSAASSDPEAGRRAVHVVRAPHASLVVLAQHGRSVLFSAPIAAQALRLLAPAVRLSHALPDRGGVPVELRAEVHGRRVQLSAMYGGERRATELALSPAYGWTMVLPGGIEPGVRLRLAGALWLGGLLFPAAYWAARAERPGRALSVVALAGLAGLGLVPLLTGYAPAHWSEWLGVSGGIALGWALHRFAAYLQSRCGSPSTSAYSSS